MEPADFAHFDADSAQVFLKELPPQIRERGEDYFKAGRVRDLRADNPGAAYTADVEGTTLYQTTLRYDPETKSWWEECSCPMGGGCKHAYAAMKALLVEHSAASVQSLSAGRKTSKKPIAALASGTLAVLPVASGQAVPPLEIVATGSGLKTTFVDTATVPPHAPEVVTVTVYVPAWVTPVGFCWLEVKPLGPLHE